jgi:perosamine synthetase
MFTACLANRVSYDIPERAVNLPSYPDMTASEQERVLAVLTGI